MLRERGGSGDVDDRTLGYYGKRDGQGTTPGVNDVRTTYALDKRPIIPKQLNRFTCLEKENESRVRCPNFHSKRTFGSARQICFRTPEAVIRATNSRQQDRSSRRKDFFLRA